MEKEVNKKDLIIKIILIIIIIILLIHNCCLLKTLNDNKKDNNNKKSPTGNVDIFEIDCDKDSCTKKVTPSDDTKTTVPANNDNTNPKKGEVPINEKEELVIEDNHITWNSENELRIFENPVYDMDQKIAPESSNVYQFVIKNNTKNKVKYKISFNEKNEHNINMKYRLKKGNSYVTGGENSWVSYNGLNQNDIKINSKTSDTYYLEWKWVSGEDDNKKAGIIDAYKLSIKIEAESENE